jgi:hypothetical protein
LGPCWGHEISAQGAGGCPHRPGDDRDCAILLHACDLAAVAIPSAAWRPALVNPWSGACSAAPKLLTLVHANRACILCPDPEVMGPEVGPRVTDPRVTDRSQAVRFRVGLARRCARRGATAGSPRCSRHQGAAVADAACSERCQWASDYLLTNGHSPWSKGRQASSAGMVASCL